MHKNKFLVTYMPAAGATNSETKQVEADYLYVSDNNAVFYGQDKKAIGVIPLDNVKSILPVS